MANWERWLDRWQSAGLLDADAAARIRGFEKESEPALRWPVWVALTLGALLVGAGALLFVSSHWDRLSPGARLTLVLLMVALFHAGGAWFAPRFAGLSSALHAVGTFCCGAGIYLAGQIFHLEEHWPGGVLMWAAGAAAAWGLLRDWPQMAFTALLAPTWIASELGVRVGGRYPAVPAAFVLLVCLAYLDGRRVPRWIGGLALLPAAFVLHIAAKESHRRPALSLDWEALGWVAAFALPPLAAWWLRGRKYLWRHVLWAAWAAALVAAGTANQELICYAWEALGAVALVVWGVEDGRVERVNLGIAGFAVTVLAFYASNVMDALGRSASLTGLGVLFLAGGWGLERMRRRLVARIAERQS